MLPKTEPRNRRRARPLHRIEAQLCLAAAIFSHVDGQKWCGFSSRRDYVRGRLGVRWADFCQWRRIGLLLLASPRACTLLRSGRLTISSLDLIARYCPEELREDFLPHACKLSCTELRQLLQQAAPRDATDLSTSDDSGTQLRQFTLPADSLPYVHESLELAHALQGRDGSEGDAVEAILAEVAGELDPTLIDQSPPQPRGRRQRPTPRLRWAALPTPELRTRRDRRSARKLDRILRRLLARRRASVLEEEDRLLAQLEAGAHREAGFRNFEHWCDRELKLSPRTAWQRIRRARQRRRLDPIAAARAEGRLTVVQSDLLAELREIGMAADALPTWVDLAPRVTTTRLREMVLWARLQDATNRSNWAASGFLPPSRAQLQTSNRAIEDIALDPAPPDPRTLATTRLTTLRWRLHTPLAEQLDSTIAALQQRRPDSPGPRRVPKWWALLHALALARLSWATNIDDQPTRKRMRAAIRRDRYRCQAPECSWRRHLQSHHLRYQSRGGGDELSNLLTLCPFHHLQGEHGGLTRVRGQVVDSTDDLYWELGLDHDGPPLLRYRGDTVLDPQVEGVPLGT